jgi:hypothetical protein
VSGPSHAEVEAGPAEVAQDAAVARAGAASFGLGAWDSGQLLTLQHLGGNRAAQAAIGRFAAGEPRPAPAFPPPPRAAAHEALAGRALAAAVLDRTPPRSIARCPGHQCRCNEFDKGPGRVTLAEIPIGDQSLRPMVARQPEEVSESAQSSGVRPANASVVEDKSHLRPSISVNDADARAIVAHAIATIGGVPGAKVFPFDEAIAANEPPTTASGEQSIATWPAGKQMIQRSILHMLEGGFVGSLQLCYDFCKGQLSVVGWIWAGLGVVTPGWFGGKKFRGAYVFAEKEFGSWDFDLKVDCGKCPTECKASEHSSHWGIGGANFPINLKPGEKKKLGMAGLEVGLLVTPHSFCDADIEVIALIDLTKYLGPVGAAVSAAAKGITQFTKRWGLEVECGVGVDISGAIHVCRDGLAMKADSAKVCGGGYVGCGIGLEHEKSALPGI